MTNSNAPKSKSPMAGGFLIAMGAMLGVVGGLTAGQVTIGFLVGLGIGIVAAVGIWLSGR